MAFGLLNSIIPSPGPVLNLYTGPANKLTVGKVTIGSKNYNPSRIQIGYREGNDIRYFEYNRYVKYGDVIETENIYVGAGQELVVRSTETDVNFLFYGQTTNDIINPVRSGILQHTLSTGATKQVLFTAPAGSESEVTLSICNLGPDVSTVKLGLSNGNLIDFDSTEYLDFGFSIGPGQTYTRPNIKLGSGQSLIGFSNPDSKVTFLCHGQLFYEISGSPTSDDFVVLGNSRFDGNVGVGRTATTKFDVVGNAIITGNTDIGGDTTVGGGSTITGNLIVDGSVNRINNVNIFEDDFDGVRNLRSIGITTFYGTSNYNENLEIKTNIAPLETDDLRIRSNDIVLGFTTSTTVSFEATVTGGSNQIVVNPTSLDKTKFITANRGVQLNYTSSGSFGLGNTVNVVSIASSTVTLSETVSGNGSATGYFNLKAVTTDFNADNGGIIIKGLTDKTMLWQSSTDRFNFSHGITLNAGRLQILDGTEYISIGNTNVLTSNTVLGRELTDKIEVSNDTTNYIPTATATTRRARQISAEGYFASTSI